MAQTLTVEYTVQRLDGVTPAEPIDIATEPASSDQIYRRDQDALGLIDLDLFFSSQGGSSSKFVPVFWIDAGGTVGDLDAAVDVVALEEGDTRIVLQEQVADLAGEGNFYRRQGILVPQGSNLRLSGYESSSDPIIVRLEILDLGDPLTYVEALALLVGGGGGGGADVCSANPVSITPDNSPDPGTDELAARCDHVHALPSGPPVTVSGPTNAPGSANAVARADHQHRLELLFQQLGTDVGQRPAVNFTGSVSLTDDAPNDRVNVNVTGGSAPILSASFDDDDTLDIPVGASTSGLIIVHLNLSTADGRAISYSIELTVRSGPDTALDGSSILQVLPDTPITTVAPSVLVVGSQPTVRLTGSGPGDLVEVRYQISQDIPRGFP